MSRRAITIYAFCIALLGVFCYFANRYDYFPGDINLSQWLQGIESAWFKPIMQYTPYVVGLAIVVALLFKLLWRGLIFMAVATGAAGIITWLLKELVSRPRPDAELVQVMVGTQGSSFPSGHVAMATAVGGFIFYLAPRWLKAPAAIWSLRALVIVIIAAIGLSRLYLGTHWLSDAVGGIFLGGLILYPALVLYNKYEVKHA